MTVATLTVDPRTAEPTRKEKDRSIDLIWELGEVPGRYDDGSTRVARAVLHVAYDKAGVNYFSGTITNTNAYAVSIQRDHVEGIMVSFEMFNGLGIARIDAGARFNRKRLEAAAVQGLARLRELVEEGEPKVLRYFDKDVQPSLRD